MERSEQKLDSYLERITRIEERVSHLPTKEQVVKIAIGTVTIIGALIAFQGKVRALLGL